MSALIGTKTKTDSAHQIVVGGQRVTMGVLLDLQRDAARYRWLRDKADKMACTAAPMVASLDAEGGVTGLVDGEELDAAVDMAMVKQKGRPARSAPVDRIEVKKDNEDAN